jgi:hypothetical protein
MINTPTRWLRPEIQPRESPPSSTGPVLNPSDQNAILVKFWPNHHRQTAAEKGARCLKVK